MGPFPPAFLAISSRAFLSGASSAVLSRAWLRGVVEVSVNSVEEIPRTGLLLREVSLVIIVELLLCRLGLLVVDGVGAGCIICQSLDRKRFLEPKGP